MDNGGMENWNRGQRWRRIDVVLVGDGTKTCGALGLLAWLVSTQKVRRRVRRRGYLLRLL